MDNRDIGPSPVTRRQVDLPPVSPTALTSEQVRDHTYPWIAPVAGLGPDVLAESTYARRLGDEFIELLVHRGEDEEDDEQLWRLTDGDVAKVGAADLYSLARQRLRLVPADGRDVIHLERGKYSVVHGCSKFTASKLVTLAQVLRPFLGTAVDAPTGVLVSVPTWHELAFATVDDDDLPGNLVHLARHTLMTYEDTDRPLSPHTYWWRQGTLTPMVVANDDGFIDFRFPPAFFDAFGPSAGIG